MDHTIGMYPVDGVDSISNPSVSNMIVKSPVLQVVTEVSKSINGKRRLCSPISRHSSI